MPAPAGWTPGLLAELDGYAAAIANWGRWGPDDQLGTLNLLTPQRRVAAAALVRTGTCLGLGRRIGGSPAPDNPVPPLQHMLATGEAARARAVRALDGELLLRPGIVSRARGRRG